MSIQPTIPSNIAAADPGLRDVLDAFKTEVQLGLNCHALATVQSFSKDSATGMYKVSASINYSKTYFQPDANGVLQPYQVNYPLLIDCPAVVLGGGASALQCPVAAGDQCLVLFNDRDINNWWSGARSGPVASARLHSFSDGLVLVGFQHTSINDPNHMLMTNGNAQVGVPASASSALVRIANNSTTLNTLLGNLITAINNITTTNAVPGSPCLISPASQTALSNIATQLGTLLE